MMDIKLGITGVNGTVPYVSSVILILFYTTITELIWMTVFRDGCHAILHFQCKLTVRYRTAVKGKNYPQTERKYKEPFLITLPLFTYKRSFKRSKN